MKKIYLAVLLSLGGLIEATAQQDPHYTQYMYNMNVINPAFAGSMENLSFGLLYRKQWVDIEDSPSTGTFSGHSPVGKNVGLGLSVINDKIGPVEETNAYAENALPEIPATNSAQSRRNSHRWPPAKAAIGRSLGTTRRPAPLLNCRVTNLQT